MINKIYLNSNIKLFNYSNQLNQFDLTIKNNKKIFYSTNNSLAIVNQ